MMTIKEIHSLGLKMATAVDPRGPKAVQKYLAGIKKEFDALPPKEKEYFNKERLTNPYMDSAVHFDDGRKVKRVMVGIDISEPEVLLASQLEERGKDIDLIISHHPLGLSRAMLQQAMEVFVDMFEEVGMPPHVAQKIVEERCKEIERRLHPVNHYKTLDIARILKINLMDAHTFTDNLVHDFLNSYIIKNKPERLGDLMDLLMELPEYQEAKRLGMGPLMLAGNPKNKVGKFFLEMTGGTNPSHKIYEILSRAGISTLVEMHIPEESFAKVNEQGMNIIMAGHMSSDSLGMNLYLDELEKKGIEIIPCGGLIRVSRNNKRK